MPGVQGRSRSPDPQLGLTKQRTPMPQSESDVPQSDEEESEAGSEDDGDTYVVEQILSEMQEDNGNRLYLVRWEGYGSDGDTWEPEDNMNCPELLTAFKRAREQKKAHVAPTAKIKQSHTPKRRVVHELSDSDEDASEEDAAKKLKKLEQKKALKKKEKHLREKSALAKQLEEAGRKSAKKREVENVNSVSVGKRPAAEVSTSSTTQAKKRKIEASPPPKASASTSRAPPGSTVTKIKVISTSISTTQKRPSATPIAPAKSTSTSTAAASSSSNPFAGLPSFHRKHLTSKEPSKEEINVPPSPQKPVIAQEKPVPSVPSRPIPPPAAPPINLPIAPPAAPTPSPVLPSAPLPPPRPVLPHKPPPTVPHVSSTVPIARVASTIPLGPFSLPPRAKSSLVPRSPSVGPTADPRRRRTPSMEPSSLRPTSIGSVKDRGVNYNDAVRRLKASHYYNDHREVFEAQVLQAACADVLGIKPNLALQWKNRNCSMMQDPDLIDSRKDRHDAENWALGIILIGLQAKNPKQMDEVENIFAHRDVSVDRLNAQVLDLVTRSRKDELPHVVFYAFGGGRPLEEILCSGFAVVPTLAALKQLSEAADFVPVAERSPTVSLLIHPATVVSARNAGEHTWTKTIPQSVANTSLVIRNDVLPPTSMFIDISSSSVSSLFPDEILPVVPTATELEEIELFLRHSRITSPAKYRRLVMVVDRVDPVLENRLKAHGIEVLTWEGVANEVDLAFF